MRRAVPALLLVFLAALPAAAQFTLSDEVVSDPLQADLRPLSLAAPAVALAQDRAGVAIGWSMANGDGLDRIYVTRLDAAGHVAGAVRELPLASTAPAHASYLSLAEGPGGSGFVAAWIESDRDVPAIRHVAYSRLDAALTPSAPVALAPMGIDNVHPPVVRTKGGTTWIAAGGLWTIGRDGALTGPIGGVVASDMTIATDVPQYVGATNIRGTSYTCRPDPGCVQGHFPGLQFCLESCRIYAYTYSVDFTALLTTSQAKPYQFGSDAQPAIGSNGSDLLVAWFSGEQAKGGDVVAVRLGPGEFGGFSEAASHPTQLALFPPDQGPTRPSIAGDGQHYVIVWRSRTAAANHDVVGMIIGADGKLTPLSIATSDSDETDPAILSLGGGTFLIAYEKGAPAERRRIAGRFLTFPTRPRATR